MRGKNTLLLKQVAEVKKEQYGQVGLLKQYLVFVYQIVVEEPNR